MAQYHHIHEGTAQDLVPYLTQHPHQRFRLIALSSEEEIPIDDSRQDEGQSLAVVFSELIEAAKYVERETHLPPTDPHEIAFQEALKEKYRKMGLHR